MSSEVSAKYVGRVSFSKGRELQKQIFDSCQKSLEQQSILYCEHPATISLGKRTRPEDLLLSREEFSKMGVELVDVNRGGGPTYHGPGQLLIYPMISLPAFGLGVRNFVTLGLEAIAVYCRDFVEDVQISISKPGVWIAGRKIASVGLRIVHGFTFHGFSFNVSNEQEIYSKFSPCGFQNLEVTSLGREIGSAEQGVSDLKSIAHSIHGNINSLLRCGVNSDIVYNNRCS